MATYIHSGAVTADPIGGLGNMMIKSIMLTSSSGNASITVKGQGTTAIVINCPANDTKVYPATSGGNQYSLIQVTGPVTVDITGAASFVRIEY